MSKEVDERVVSMQFNNKNFEANAQTTLGTLDKLKQKLNLSGASKGLENVGAAAKKVDMSGISSGIETVRTRFSALEVMGVTALANITNSAVNAGKRIVSALTIDPVKTGLSEYELKLNSVQTIMASTGEDIKTVNKYLEDLNTYSDQTIYSFSDMTQNIGKFTNAGVKLEDAVTAIKGISNAAALSGANTQEASRSMYNFAQALSAGYVKLIDWKSIELANMATKGFKEELIKTAVEVGTLTKKGDQYVSTTTDMNGKVSEAFTSTKFFNESLSAQWMTTDVLIKTLARYTDETTQLGKDATQAATQVKSLSQMFDVLKETAQSGWAKTWEIIFGDLEQAKAIFTPLTSFFGKIIDKMSDFRNKILEGALGNPFELLLKKLDASPLGKITKTITDATGKLEYYQDIVSKVWNGDYKNAPVRYQLLDDAGYDHRIVQSLVNKGYEYKLTVKDIEDAYKKYGKTVETVTEPTKDLAKTLEELSDEELKNLGYTDEEIRMLRALAQEAKKTGKPISELIAEMSKADGRTLLVDSFKNIGKAIGDLGKTIKKAWQEIFPPKTAEERSIQLYNLIKALNSFTKKLQMSTDTADKFRRTFKGVFALLDIILTVIGGPIKLVFKILKQLLGVANIDLLSLTAIIGDGIVKFRDWIDRVLDFTDVFKKLLPTLKKAGKAFGDWIDKLKQSDNIPRDIILGLVNGLKAGITIVGKTMWDLGKTILEKIKAVLGIHSPSTEFMEVGKNIILGLIKGLQNGLGWLWDLTKNIGKKLIEIVKDISLDKILLGFIAGGIVVAFVKIAGALRGLTAPLKGFGDMMEGLGDMFEGLGASLKANAWKKKADAIKSIAVAIAILVGSVIALSFIKPGKLWASIGALAVLAAVVVALAFAASKMGDLKDMGKATISIVGIAASLLLAAMALKKLAGIETDQMKTAVFGLIAVTSAMVGLIAIFGLFAKNKSMYRAGKMLQQMAVAMLIMTVVIKIMSMLDAETVRKGMTVITLVGGVFAGMVAISYFAGQHAKSAGSMLIKMSLAFAIMGIVIKQLAKIKDSDVTKGLRIIVAIGGVFAAAILLSMFAGENAKKAGSMLLKMSAAFLIMSLTIKILATMNEAAVERGIKVIASVAIMFAGFMVLSKFSGSQADKIGTMLLAISGALLIMTGVIWLLSLFEPKDLVQGLAALTLMEACIAGLIAVTHLAKGSKDMQKVLIILTAAIVLLVGAVIGLSFLDPSDLARSTAAIVLVIGAFAALIGITKLANGTKDVQKTLITLTIVVAALAGIIAALSFLKPESVIASSKAISILLISLSASMLILSKVKKISTSAKSALLQMIGVVAGLAVVLGLLSVLKVQASIQSAIALGVLLNAMALSMLILSKVGNVKLGGIGALALLGLVIGELGLILGLLNKYDLNASLSTVMALSAMLIVMTAILPILALVGSFAGPAALGVVVLGVLGLVVFEVGYILGLLSGYNLGGAMPMVMTLSTMLIVMTAILPILAVVGAVGAAAIVGVGVLAVLIAAIGGLIVGIGALVEKFPSLEQFLNTGIPILEKIGYGLGSFFGNIVGGFLGGVTNGLPDMANDLSLFMTNLKPFIDGAKTIDSSVVSGVTSIAGVVLALTAANILEGLTSWFTGGSSIADFGAEIAEFGPHLKAFGDSVKGIDGTSIHAAANAAKALAQMADTIPNEGGVIGWFAGESSISKFAGELQPLGEGLREFSEEVAGVNPEAITAAANAAKTLAEMTDAIPNEGGVAGWFAGENSISKFADELQPLGEGLKAFSDETNGINPETVKAAAGAAQSIAEMADKVPNSGGVAGWFAGENSLAQFADDLQPLGEGLKAFSDETNGINPETVKAAAGAAQSIAEMADTIPNSGGVAAWFAGDNSLAQFAGDLKPLGEGLKAFSDATKGISAETVKAGVEAAGSIADMTKKLPETSVFGKLFTGEQSLADFSSDLKKFGKGIKGYSDELKGVNPSILKGATEAAGTVIDVLTRETQNTQAGIFTAIAALPEFGKAVKAFYLYVQGINIDTITSVTKAITRVNSVANNFSSAKTILMSKAVTNMGNSLKGLASISPNSTKGFVQSIKNLSEVNIDTFVSALKDGASALEKVGTDAVDAFVKGALSRQSSACTRMKNIGVNLINTFNIGVQSQKGRAGTASLVVLKACLAAIQSKYASFKVAGGNVAKGFANGISANTFLAAAKARAMAAAAAEAAKKELDEHSPSRVFYDVGDFAGVAFVNALGDYVDTASDAGGELAKASIDGLRSSMSNMFDVINGNLDVQPTIAPVLDLSEVQSGARHINDLFSGNRTLSVNGRTVGNVSMRISEIQNGRNNDLLSAIKSLSKDVANMPRNNYNINGLSYEEGSDVAEALQTIIRVAKIERRV